MRNVFEQLRQAGLTIKLNKCSFGTSECIYLEHQIRKGEVWPEATNVQAINDMPRPRTKKEVHSFLEEWLGITDDLSGTLVQKQNHLPN